MCENLSVFEINMKMEMKIQNISHRDEINRLKVRHGHTYIKDEMCRRMMMPKRIKHHLSNISLNSQQRVISTDSPFT